MSTQRKKRAELRARQTKPKNVSVKLRDGITKILTYKEYQEFLRKEENAAKDGFS